MKLPRSCVFAIAFATVAISPVHSDAQDQSYRAMTISTGVASTTQDRFRSEVQPLIEITGGWRSSPWHNVRLLVGGLAGFQTPVAGSDDCPIDSTGGCQVRLPSTKQIGLQFGGEISNEHAGLSLATGPALVSVASFTRVTNQLVNGRNDIEHHDAELTSAILTRAELFANLGRHAGLVLAAHSRYLRSVGGIGVTSKGASFGFRVHW